MSDRVTVPVYFDVKTGELVAAEKAVGRVGNAAKTTGDKFGKLKGVVAGVFAAAALRSVIGYTRELMKLGAEIEETSSKFSTVFGAAARDADAALKEFANTAGLTQNEIRGVASTFGAVAQGMGETQEASADLSVQAVRLAADLQSFNDVPIERTAAAITSALTGQREALQSLGIVINENVIAAAKATGEYEGMSDAALTLALIAEKAGVAVGDLDRTSDSAANTARRLSAEFREQRDTLARLLLPTYGVMLETVEDITRATGDAANTIGTKLARALLEGAIRAREIATAVVTAAKGVVAFGQTVETFSDVAMPSFSGVIDSAVADMKNMSAEVFRVERAFLKAMRGMAQFEKLMNQGLYLIGDTQALARMGALIQVIDDTTSRIRKLDVEIGVIESRASDFRRGDYGPRADASRSYFDDLLDTLVAIGIESGTAKAAIAELQDTAGGGGDTSGADAPDVDRLVTDADESALQGRSELSDMDAMAQAAVDGLDDVDQRAKEVTGSLEAYYTAVALNTADLIATGIGGFTDLFAEASRQNEAFFTAYKAIAVAEAIASTFVAANRALASAPPPFNFALAASVTAAGLANVLRISSANPGSSAGSGSTQSPGGTSTAPRSPSSVPAGLVYGNSGDYGGGFGRQRDLSPVINNRIDYTPPENKVDVFLNGKKVNRELSATERREQRRRGARAGL